MRVKQPAGTRKNEIVAAVLQLADGLGPARLTTEAAAQAVDLSQTAPAAAADSGRPT